MREHIVAKLILHGAGYRVDLVARVELEQRLRRGYQEDNADQVEYLVSRLAALELINRAADKVGQRQGRHGSEPDHQPTEQQPLLISQQVRKERFQVAQG